VKDEGWIGEKDKKVKCYKRQISEKRRKRTKRMSWERRAMNEKREGN